MGERTGISWTDSTFNLWIGCTKIGPGCDNCYAEAGNIRWQGGRNWGPGAPRLRTGETYRQQIDRWNRKALKRYGRPRRVFVNSWSDIFDNEVDQAWRDEFWPAIERCLNIEFQLVTKRIGNAAKMVPARWMSGGWPSNAIVLATVTDQEEFDRDWPKLAALPCRRGLSVEPQLGALSIKGAAALHWVIGGGESRQMGRQPRPYKLEWARALIRECRAASVAYFQKQLGAMPVPQTAIDLPFLSRAQDHDQRSHPLDWPTDLRVQEFPLRR